MINLASRLQSSLGGVDDANKLFLSHEARQMIEDPEMKRIANAGQRKRASTTLMPIGR